MACFTHNDVLLFLRQFTLALCLRERQSAYPASRAAKAVAMRAQQQAIEAFERRVRPIYDALDSRNSKASCRAMQACNWKASCTCRACLLADCCCCA